jgi:hypothetical protein
MKYLIHIVFFAFVFLNCNSSNKRNEVQQKTTPNSTNLKSVVKFDTSHKTIHVFVALCDNKYQGIIPVPAAIGNGQQPNTNLYWGCAFGVKSYFNNSSKWTLVKSMFIDSIKLERLIFKYKNSEWFLIADAYDGKNIKECTVDYLNSCAGKIKDTLIINGLTLGINGNSKLLSYIGHDGLMDFKLDNSFVNADGIKRDAIILACISKKYFSPYVKAAKANPLVWSTGLMSPEAYTLHDALEKYIKNGSAEEIQISAAKAYSKYQKCSDNAAKKLLVTGY